MATTLSTRGPINEVAIHDSSVWKVLVPLFLLKSDTHVRVQLSCVIFYNDNSSNRFNLWPCLIPKTFPLICIYAASLFRWILASLRSGASSHSSLHHPLGYHSALHPFSLWWWMLDSFNYSYPWVSAEKCFLETPPPCQNPWMLESII